MNVSAYLYGTIVKYFFIRSLCGNLQGIIIKMMKMVVVEEIKKNKMRFFKFSITLRAFARVSLTRQKSVNATGIDIFRW